MQVGDTVVLSEAAPRDACDCLVPQASVVIESIDKKFAFP